ncbi:MAG: MotA/TolQ/ExbB proton channel family protein [Deltaproteobacteria bacterium]|nr:MotA/TolQ/ExbB proton channel family protein [Deltaproteobacteria bacterium]
MLIFFCVSVFSSTVVFAQVPSFEQAYAHELEQLQATRNALLNSADQFEQNLAQERAKFGGEIRQSESELLALKKRRRALEAKRDRLAERHMVLNDNDAALHALPAGSGESLHSVTSPASGKDAALAEDDLAAFLLAVDKAVAKVDTGSRLHVADGMFFDLHGKQINGKIVHIGDIAALGVSSTTGGVLLKIQGGYRLLDDGPKAQAKRMAAGETPEWLDVFLFSPESTGHDPNKNNGFQGTLNKGGPVAWIIAGLALMGLLLVVERVWTLSLQTNWRTSRFNFIAQKLKTGDFTGASTGTRGMGAVGRVLRVLIKERELPREDAEKRVSEIILKSMPALERSLTILTVITAVAPLLGLLGTVTGMISTFDVITEFGTGDPKLLSGGISEALITTKLGLAVAVPFLLVRSLMTRWSDRIIENMQTYSLTALNIMSGPITSVQMAVPASGPKEESTNE